MVNSSLGLFGIQFYKSCIIKLLRYSNGCLTQDKGCPKTGIEFGSWEFQSITWDEWESRAPTKISCHLCLHLTTTALAHSIKQIIKAKPLECAKRDQGNWLMTQGHLARFTYNFRNVLVAPRNLPAAAWRARRKQYLVIQLEFFLEIFL